MTGKPKRLRIPEWNSSLLLPDLLMSLVYVLMLQPLGSALSANAPGLMHKYLFMFWLVIPMLLFLVMRRFVLPVLPMIIGHVIIALLPLLFLQKVDIQLSFCFMTLIGFLLYNSLSRKYRNTFVVASQLQVIMTIIVNFLFLIIVLTFREYNLMPFVFSSCLISICLYLAANQLINFENTFEHFLMSPTQPGKQIKANNQRIIFFLILALCVIIPLVLVIPYDAFLQILEKFATLFTAVLFYLISLIPQSTSLSYTEDVVTNDPALDETPVIDSQIITILEVFFAILIILLVLFLLGKCVKIFMIFLRDRYIMKHSTVTFSPNENVTDEIFDLRVDRSHKRRRKKDFGSGEEHRIRKLYYDTVRKGIRSGVLYRTSSSSGEMAREMKEKLGNDISELTNQYDEIRYGK